MLMLIAAFGKTTTNKQYTYLLLSDSPDPTQTHRAVFSQSVHALNAPRLRGKFKYALKTFPLIAFKIKPQLTEVLHGKSEIKRTSIK